MTPMIDLRVAHLSRKERDRVLEEVLCAQYEAEFNRLYQDGIRKWEAARIECLRRGESLTNVPDRDCFFEEASDYRKMAKRQKMERILFSL